MVETYASVGIYYRLSAKSSNMYTTQTEKTKRSNEHIQIRNRSKGLTHHMKFDNQIKNGVTDFQKQFGW